MWLIFNEYSEPQYKRDNDDSVKYHTVGSASKHKKMVKALAIVFVVMLFMFGHVAHSASVVGADNVSGNIEAAARGICLTRNEVCGESGIKYGGCCSGLKCKCTNRVFGGCRKWKCK